MTTSKNAPKDDDADVTTSDETPADDTRTWIVYTDKDGETHRVTTDEYKDGE